MYNTFNNEVQCQCSVCSLDVQGFVAVSAQTARRHADNDLVRHFMQTASSLSAEAIQMENDNNMEIDAEVHDVDAHVESENEDEDIIELDTMEGSEYEAEEFEEQFSSSNMPADNTHAFIAAFATFFISKYVVNSGGAILIKFLNEVLAHFGESFRLPLSLSGLSSMTGFNQVCKGVQRYVVCGECHKTYMEFDGVPQCCNFRRLSGGICGADLFKPSRNVALPKKVYMYNSLISALSVLFCRPGFESSINHWRHRQQVAGMMFDVYDGAKWSNLEDSNGQQFVAHERSIMLTLNIDWFQPFDGVTYSCGAIYMSINNLPRDERYKKENTILVGLMPGPKEAKTSEINHYLRPLVAELQSLYVGVVIPTVRCPSGALVRAALFLVACDIPAARKTCGFTSHMSTNACHKCNRQFSHLPGNGGVDYSGFVFSEWVPRTEADNRRDALAWKRASSEADQKRMEKENGVRWSELHNLEYFNVVECTIIDPMHNLFLGTSKRVMEKWRSAGLITNRDLADMQQEADNMVLPPDMSTLKKKIGKDFPFMKADEWKSWCLVYSPVLLKDRLPRDNLDNWMCFVNACRYLSKPSISEDELAEAHFCLELFGQGCQNLYGADFISPNMHLHLHLHETIVNFGPVYGYWLFSFERYNGVLKNYTTNKRDGFEATFMRKYLEDSCKVDIACRMMAVIGNASYIALLSELVEFTPPPAPIVHASTATTTVTTAPYFQVASPRFDLKVFLDSAQFSTVNIKGNEPLPSSAFPLSLGQYERMVEEEYEHLLEFYRDSYDDDSLRSYQQASFGNVFVNNMIQKFPSINLLGQIYKGSNGAVRRGSYIQAIFQENNDRGISAFTGQIQYLFVNSLVNPQTLQPDNHTFAYVKWYRSSGLNTRSDEGIELNEFAFARGDYQNILPVHRILLSVAIGEHTTETGNVKMIVAPVLRKIYA
ncbi:hypothetical protein INT47_010971 [Mucor saturninus]|uniref:Transposase domain-containing protein n=1 Tax=Mucor saturninus TaxID=64648 RepID=A0A8H7QFK1_9FUNG|nr:hypothetical protein INT47_010971 [Mucor saturninus]